MNSSNAQWVLLAMKRIIIAITKKKRKAMLEAKLTPKSFVIAAATVSGRVINTTDPVNTANRGYSFLTVLKNFHENYFILPIFAILLSSVI
jgi:hypothetical protein